MGPFPVGVRTIEFRDTSRPKDDGSPRILLTEVWYPASEAARGQPGVSYDMRPMLTPEQQAKIAELKIPLLETPAVRDAPARTDRGPYPLVVFSHGQGGIRWQSTFYTVLLASHGYVVVSPDHEGNTIADALADRLTPPTEGVGNRPGDVSILLTLISRLKAEHPLANMVDMERVGVTGHSFGGLTSLRVAALDKRVKVIVPQTPPSTELSWIGISPVQLDIPVMIQASRLDRTLPWTEHIDPSWGDFKRPRYLMELVTGGHFTFSDLCGFNLEEIAKKVDIDVGDVLSDGCGPTAPPAAQAQRMINHFAVGLFNSVLRHSPGSAAPLT
ncbi:MAG: alpha/beta hydrolase family protein, partial [Myxococcales bacterium]